MSRTNQLNLLTAVALTFAGGCDGDPYCGDGTVNTPTEQCDDANNDDTDFCLSSCIARPIPSLIVKWAFNQSDELGFSGDSCTDLGARNVRVVIDGPISETIDESCSFRQVTFADIPAGSYDVRIEVLDAGEARLTSDVIVTSYDFGGGDEEFTVPIPYDAWSADYDGSFFFRVTWGGLDCSPESAVTHQQLTFNYAGGGPVASVTKVGDSLMGSQSNCYTAGQTEPQTVLDVPFGPATLSIQGLDIDSNVVYDTTFDTFIGVGLNNPELSFDVAAVP